LGVANQTITLNLEAGMTQLAQSNGIDSVVADGVPPGDLQDLVVDDNGFLTARFDNGRSLVLYQIPVATFLSPNELSAEQNGVYRSTLAAGAFTINSAGDGAAGSIRAGVLESSNVDLASEFTQMITTQRAYSASSKVISTADEMLEELIRIKR
jgi:flagellar hook protein FlgE